MLQSRRALRRSSRAASVATSNEIFNEAVAPLGLRPLHAGHRHAAGAVPLCRHSLVQHRVRPRRADHGAADLVDGPGDRARRAVLSRGQPGDQGRSGADAEPGKILHEVRHGEMAELGEVPFRHYYGSVDSTPLFVMLAGAYLAAHRRCRDAATSSGRNIEAALGWIEHYGDRDGDGFVEYYRMTEKGLANQGWKDSHDSIFHADGTPGRRSDRALRGAGAMSMAPSAPAARSPRRSVMPERAERCASRPARCASGFEPRSGREELGTYALALDGDKRPCLVRSSNAGHLLLTGLAAPERAPARAAAARWAAPSFSGWGVRTIASTEARYNPMSYHNGSVWPHDNALIGMGFARYGLRAEAARIFEGLFAACILYRPAPPAGAGLRLPAPALAGADLLPRRLRAAGLGGRLAAEPIAILPRPRLRPGDRARWSSTARCCRPSWRRWSCAACRSAPAAIDVVLRGRGGGVAMPCCRAPATSARR